MRILPIGDTAKHKYQGSGHAVVAIAGSQIVDIVYLSSIFPDLDESDDAQIEAAIVDDRTGPVVRYLSALGDVAVGMCSCYEFLER